MKGIVRVLNSQGDTAVEFDTETGVVEEAEKIIRQAQANSSALFDGTTREQIGRPTKPQSPKKVLGEHEEVLIVPPMAGG